jgi:hypothetical protein
VRLRTWERTLERLADGYRGALARHHARRPLGVGAGDRAA